MKQICRGADLILRDGWGYQNGWIFRKVWGQCYFWHQSLLALASRINSVQYEVLKKCFCEPPWCALRPWQGGRSCAGARGAPAEKFGMGRKIFAQTYLAYFTELNLQICDYAQKRRICRKNGKYAFDEHFHGYFCPWRNAAKFCHPGPYLAVVCYSVL